MLRLAALSALAAGPAAAHGPSAIHLHPHGAEVAIAALAGVALAWLLWTRAR
ncbi:hypothetical protein [Roseitranquillus sediminis]|uniref:hypothetical protein n=1 Tax=Roseitranquillus sediminis TaxID=2809051 RepID=UPI001D0CCAE6|nr:hypothetical protein [Roseitranquillus sediminis]MBM9595150.1 hypothetical protein [Roseitranquillus sediminis]